MNIRWIALTLIPLVAACASVPAYRYYTLDMRPSGNVSGSARLDSVVVRVGEALSKNELLVRTSPTQIEYYALDRWASGLDEQIAEKLLAEFSTASPNAPAIWIESNLLAFEQVDTPGGADAYVKIDVRAGWFNDGRRNTDVHRIYDRTVPADSSTPDAVVQALSRTVEAIALDIANEPALQPQNFRGAASQ